MVICWNCLFKLANCYFRWDKLAWTEAIGDDPTLILYVFVGDEAFPLKAYLMMMVKGQHAQVNTNRVTSTRCPIHEQITDEFVPHTRVCGQTFMIRIDSNVTTLTLNVKDSFILFHRRNTIVECWGIHVLFLIYLVAFSQMWLRGLVDTKCGS